METRNYYHGDNTIVQYREKIRNLANFLFFNPQSLIFQYKAVCDDQESDYNTLLDWANVPTLELSRQSSLCIQVFKCVNEQT